MRKSLPYWVAGILLLATHVRGETPDPLPSWSDTAPKKAIIAFVEKTTSAGSPDFVPPSERIATFDNDGTLWVEQPNYVQGLFLVDRIKALAPRHPEWKEKEPFASLLNAAKEKPPGGEKAIADLLMATHAGMTNDEFVGTVADWLVTARHPRFKRPFTECVYQPMLELLAYLETAGYKTFIISGGGTEFIRVFSEKTYGVPPERAMGSSIKTRYEIRDGKPELVREAAINFIDDGPGKPVGIGRLIGRRPVMAFGNSDGDYQMLEYTTGSPGPRFGLLVHHDDAKREYAYDRKSSVGRLDKALDAAPDKGWIVVSMKDDWLSIFPPPVKTPDQ